MFNALVLFSFMVCSWIAITKGPYSALVLCIYLGVIWLGGLVVDRTDRIAQAQELILERLDSE